MAEPTYTKEEIERLFLAAQTRCQKGWQEPYKFGYLQGITAVMVEFDDYRRRKAQIDPSVAFLLDTSFGGR